MRDFRIPFTNKKIRINIVQNLAEQLPEVRTKFVYTFKTGERLFQVDMADVALLQNRYYKNILAQSEILACYGIRRQMYIEQVETLRDLNKKHLAGAIDNVERGLNTEAVLSWMLKAVEDYVPAEEELLQHIFNMHFVLEGEPVIECHEYWNLKKKELLLKDDEARMFFFQKCQNLINNSINIRRQDTLAALTVIAEAKKLNDTKKD